MTKGLSDVYEFLDHVEGDIEAFVKCGETEEYQDKDFYDDKLIKFSTCYIAHRVLDKLSSNLYYLLERLSKVISSMTPDGWNHWYDIGTKVIYIGENGEFVKTKTTGLALSNPGGSPIVRLDGIEEVVPLYNVFPVSVFNKLNDIEEK